MDKTEIAMLAHQMGSKEDILTLLNRIKQEDMVESGLADKFYPFTMKHINYYWLCHQIIMFIVQKMKKN